MSNMHYIKAPCHQSKRSQGYQFAPDEVKEKYDFEVPIKTFSGSRIDKNKGHKICQGYEILYQNICDTLIINKNTKIVTIGGDNSISAATISAMNKNYDNLKVLYIDTSTDIETYETSNTKNLNEMPIASLIGLCDPPFVSNKLLLKPSQIIYIGLNDDCDLSLITDLDIEFYTSNKIKQLGIDVFKNIIKESVGDSQLHVCIDLKVFDKSIVSSTEPVNENGLLEKDILPLFNLLKDQVVSLDITEFNPTIGDNLSIKNTRELCRKCIVELFNVKERSINIFNEDSSFLIFRSSEQTDETDYGWYILQNISLDEREKLIKTLDDDIIKCIDIEDEEFMITKTTVKEQNTKSYYASKDVIDTVLFPDEKAVMCFELINTN